MSSGSICINQPLIRKHALCYGMMFDRMEECSNCIERPKCKELTQAYLVEKTNKKIKKFKCKLENVYIKGTNAKNI
jgi:hypothetical protein